MLVAETSPDRLWSGVTAWLEGFGFDRVVHLAIGARGEVAARSTLGPEFEARYREQGLARFDPFLTYCLPAPAPVATGADYLPEYDYLSPDEKRVILLARDTGFRAGFSLVTRRGPLGCEAWNIGSCLGRAEVERLRTAHQGELALGLTALRGRLQAGVPDGLTPREQECLSLLAKGLRGKEIALACGLSVVTVEMHLRNARRKLGAATREQAVAAWVAGRNPG